MAEVSGWRLRSNTSAHAAVRPVEHPASTLYFGARLNTMKWEWTDPDALEDEPDA